MAQQLLLGGSAATAPRQRTGRPSCQPFVAATPAGSRRACRLQVQAGKGFDQKASAPSKQQKAKKGKLERYLDIDVKESAGSGEGWARVASLGDFVSKPLKAVILATGQAVVVYKVGDKVYCSDANSTAYQFPLVDASILQAKTGPAVEVPLDGTTYDLATGKVLSWCPKNTPLRKVLGALKDTSQPVDLRVYPTEMRGEEVWANFSTQ